MLRLSLLYDSLHRAAGVLVGSATCLQDEGATFYQSYCKYFSFIGDLHNFLENEEIADKPFTYGIPSRPEMPPSSLNAMEDQLLCTGSNQFRIEIGGFEVLNDPPVQIRSNSSVFNNQRVVSNSPLVNSRSASRQSEDTLLSTAMSIEEAEGSSKTLMADSNCEASDTDEYLSNSSSDAF